MLELELLELVLDLEDCSEVLLSLLFSLLLKFMSKDPIEGSGGKGGKAGGGSLLTNELDSLAVVGSSLEVGGAGGG